MTNDLTLLMRVAVNEEQLLRALERIIGVACCSTAFPKEAAPVYFMPLEYGEGFRFGASIAWPPSFTLNVAASEIAQGLAIEFQADVLFEAADSISDTDHERWLLASPGQNELQVVNIKELPDGVCLSSDP